MGCPKQSATSQPGVAFVALSLSLSLSRSLSLSLSLSLSTSHLGVAFVEGHAPHKALGRLRREVREAHRRPQVVLPVIPVPGFEISERCLRYEVLERLGIKILLPEYHWVTVISLGVPPYSCVHGYMKEYGFGGRFASTAAGCSARGTCGWGYVCVCVCVCECE